MNIRINHSSKAINDNSEVLLNGVSGSIEPENLRFKYAAALDTRVSHFSNDNGLKNLLDIIEFKPIRTGQELEAIFELRYDAYRREGFIMSNTDEICSDELDNTVNTTNFGVFIAGKLASAMRISILSKEYPNSASMKAFPDLLQPRLDCGQVFIDPSRFVADLKWSTLFPELPTAMMKIPIMAAQFFQANYGLSSVRQEHAAFYRRIFHAVKISESRSFPGMNMNVVLLQTDTNKSEKWIFRKYPFFNSNYFEQSALFGERVLPQRLQTIAS